MIGRTQSEEAFATVMYVVEICFYDFGVAVFLL